MFVCCGCCVLSGRGLCDELITRSEESYRLCCVVVCDLETSRIGAPYIYIYIYIIYDISSLRVKQFRKNGNYECMNVVVPRPDLRCFYICLEVMNSHENVIVNAFGNVTPLILVDIFGGRRG